MVDWENERRKWDTAGEDYGSGRLARSEPSSGRGSSKRQEQLSDREKVRSVRAHPPAPFPPAGCVCKPPSHSGHYSYCPLNAFGVVIGDVPET